MTPLQASQARLHTLRALTTACLGRAADGELARAVSLAEAALDRAEEIKVAYGPDELALDSLVSAVTVCESLLRGASKAKQAEHQPKLRALLQRAVRLRVRALIGEEEETPTAPESRRSANA